MLVSMYRMEGPRVGRAGDLDRCFLGFVTVSVDQLLSGSCRQAEIGPVHQRIARLGGLSNDSGRDQLVIPVPPPLPSPISRGSKLRDNASMRRHRYSLSGFCPADVLA